MVQGHPWYVTRGAQREKSFASLQLSYWPAKVCQSWRSSLVGSTSQWVPRTVWSKCLNLQWAILHWAEWIRARHLALMASLGMCLRHALDNCEVFTNLSSTSHWPSSTCHWPRLLSHVPQGHKHCAFKICSREPKRLLAHSTHPHHHRDWFWFTSIQATSYINSPSVFAHHPNRSTGDEISMALFSILTHSYIRMLFVDLS